ncbi:MAG: RluA family pseudouridine synthase [Prevotella sp.]|nr:RluA family pseudouridine synthase [Candidatus Prevotella equi]
MFGVLIAESPDGKTHVLKAYSGQILGRSDWEGYVPAIFDYLQEDGYFKRHEAIISDINNKIRQAQALLPKGKRSAEVEAMKAERKERSNILQRWLFSQFILTGCDGSRKSVLDVFTDYAKANNLKQILPPGGTGECCAPKLLHYANSHNLKPLELVEFWYGASPKGEVRHHGQFYEPCQAKCQPILWYLAPPSGLKILGGQPTQQHTPQLSLDDIIYEDEWFIAINKPAKLLSVPGKRQMPNAEDQLKALLDNEKPTPFLKMTHRLDMDTSGILLAAKSPEAHEAMQRKFALHEDVRKTYEAILSGNGVAQSSGVINLPLSPDFLNRPRQCVDYESGKEAITEYEFLDETRIILRPLTGRTHQLRMHCAHADGLNMPILGDPLYGNTPAERMFLHASQLQFRHPFTSKAITISSQAPF